MSSFNHKGSSSMTINICEAFGSVNNIGQTSFQIPINKEGLTRFCQKSCLNRFGLPISIQRAAQVP